MNRWVLEMRDYYYMIENNSWKKNEVADQLSMPVRVIQGGEHRKWMGKKGEKGESRGEKMKIGK